MDTKRKLQRSELIPFFEKREACTVVLEACGAAHHWARVLTGLGHDVKLIAPETVKPFVKKGRKNDAADAAAICEAASRPGVKFVSAKSLEQQSVLMLHSARCLLVKQQTMLANAIRGLATEFGLTVPKGIGKLEELIALVHADEAFPGKARRVLTGLFDHCRAITASIETFEAEIVAHARQDETARRLADDPRYRADHRVSDRGDGRRYRHVQKRTTFRCLARSSIASSIYWWKEPPWPDNQDGQSGDTEVAGSGSHVDGLSGSAMEERRRALDQGGTRTSPCQAGHADATPSCSYCGIQPLQFYAGIGGGEVPIGFDMFFVSAVLPGGDLLDQGQLVGDTPIETLTRQHAQLGFSHVQPTAVFGGVVPLEPLTSRRASGAGKAS